jgi:hypothetical protein
MSSAPDRRRILDELLSRRGEGTVGVQAITPEAWDESVSRPMSNSNQTHDAAWSSRAAALQAAQSARLGGVGLSLALAQMQRQGDYETLKGYEDARNARGGGGGGGGGGGSKPSKTVLPDYEPPVDPYADILAMFDRPYVGPPGTRRGRDARVGAYAVPNPQPYRRPNTYTPPRTTTRRYS